MMLHLQLRDQIASHYSGQLRKEVVLLQDALQLSLANGVEIEIRYFSPAEYSFRWLWAASESRIDTAPLHPGLKTSPNHLHDSNGHIVDDPLTVHGADPWSNVRAVLDALLKNPALD